MRSPHCAPLLLLLLLPPLLLTPPAGDAAVITGSAERSSLSKTSQALFRDVPAWNLTIRGPPLSDMRRGKRTPQACGRGVCPPRVHRRNPLK
ncbi:prokineticin-2 isoform X2 [Rhinolophus ferrumequinum]|uniref:prokineticin-2 isoform X2 n=1 Tax=Rhinolophus ferrumequinum TaxID=59479 RepID=UPI00140F6E8B|nr:prokineticin-2 isoform X2 [Rhinolophus ferrumequinum]